MGAEIPKEVGPRCFMQEGSETLHRSRTALDLSPHHQEGDGHTEQVPEKIRDEETTHPFLQLAAIDSEIPMR